ncbi:uncharacterized protein [Miscanthus floridulus]|uniref:uncharacterized protein n=1 Tax=Miscanthus floridulus TaxID=154761 RepID=UPI003457EEF8
MDPEKGWWDEHTVRDVFWEEDVLHILATPTNPGHEDRLAWHFDLKGRFSVKSAYHVLDDDKEGAQVRQEGQSSSGSSSAERKSAFWRKVWKLQILKHFLWRLARNSLALKLNIQGRGIKLDRRCPVCRLDEDGGHCFLKWKAKDAPNLTTRREQRWRAPPTDFLKINSDGAFVQATFRGGWGFVIRDHQGDAVIAGVGRLAAVPDALTAEASACAKALQAAADIGISRIQYNIA